MAALSGQSTDRVPCFEIWIDALLEELCPAGTNVYVVCGQDGVMLPGRTPSGDNAWRDGVDAFGRVWRDGFYVTGVVDTEDDLRRYSVDLERAADYLDAEGFRETCKRYPDHCHVFGTHVGPFTAAYMAMGFERFFLRLASDPGFIRNILDSRTDWCIALYREAVRLGAEVLVLGDDAGHNTGPMISPEAWRELVLPCHRRIVRSLGVPVIWHSDGNVEALLPSAIEAGFTGFHGLEPSAGNDLARLKRDFGKDLTLVGNVEVSVLCGSDPAAARDEVHRCMRDGAPGGRYMIASCNSIFKGMNVEVVREMFRAEAQLGGRS
jgi:uroporphyrinogen-III decarboxylase